LELEAVGVGELWLEPERDPRGTRVNIFTFFLVCLFCLFCLFFFAMFLWSCAATQHSEEGDGNVVVVAFFFLLFCCVATLSSPSSLRLFAQQKKEEEGDDSNVVAFFAAYRNSTRRNVVLQRSVAFFATLRCNAAPQENSKEEQTKQTNEKKNKDVYLGPAWVPLWLQPQLPSSNGSKLQAPAASSYSNSPGSNSKFAPAQRLWSSGDGVRGGRVGRW
jgi:hypothetical protein